MVDLCSHYRRFKPEIDLAVNEVMEAAAFINGQAVGQFAGELADYLQTPHVIPCANGTDALQAALMALDLKPGDEVITPGFSFISSVEVIVLLGLKPVLTDINPYTFNLDPDLVRQTITPFTKAIIPVHLFGQPADMDPILDLAAAHNLQVIEDNAQSLGSCHISHDNIRRRTGTLGAIGTTSFFPTKPLACYGDGGALMTADPGLAEKIRMIVNHGSRIKYHNELIGMNSRLDTLQAAILRINLRHLDEAIERRQQVADYYDRHLGGILPSAFPPDQFTAPMCFISTPSLFWKAIVIGSVLACRRPESRPWCITPFRCRSKNHWRFLATGKVTCQLPRTSAGEFSHCRSTPK